MTNLLVDAHATLRHWRRRPALPVSVVLTLTAGLGVAIGVFAVTWAAVWRPLDVPDPQRLVWIESQSAGEVDSTSPGAALTWQADARTLEALAFARPVAGVIADDNGADRLSGALVSAAIFEVLGVRPALGRAFTAAEDVPGAARVLLLSHRLWQSRYAGDPLVVGRRVALDGRAATIIGVLPPSAGTLLPRLDWWAPLALAPSERANIGPRYLDVVGRLNPLANVDSAQQELATINARLDVKADDGTRLGVRVTPLADHLAFGHRDGLVLLLVSVIILVVIACANVATLLLTRALDRGPELALRASLGASPGRLLRQLLTESALLATIASSGGLLVALWVTALLRYLLPAETPRLMEARVDGAAAVFALGAGVVVTVLAGLVPAIRGSRVDLQTVLRAGSTGSDRLRSVFVAAQVALAMVLACAGVLLVQSARALEQAPRGYRTAGVFMGSLTLPAATYRNPADIAAVVDRIVSGAADIPGVTAAAAASQVPLAGGSAGSDVVLADEAFSSGLDRQVRVRLVGPGYLNTLGVALREGREFTSSDGSRTRPVVIVNETLARRLTPGRSPVGRNVKFGVPVFNGNDGSRVWNVVGVTADSWDRGPRVTVEPEVLIPLTQTPGEVFFWISRELQLAVRTESGARNLGPAIRRIVRAADPAIPLGQVQTLEQRVADSFASERLMARLLSGLGFAGVLLALLGLFSVVHHQVHQRRREIAIRLALGAPAPRVTAGFVRDGARLAVIGAAIGAALSAGTGRWLASLLFGVAPGDPTTLVVVAIVVISLAVVAAWAPARRVAHVDPAESLRM